MRRNKIFSFIIYKKYFIFLLTEYLFFKLFLASDNKCEEFNSNEKIFIKTENDKIVLIFSQKSNKNIFKGILWIFIYK